MRHHELVKIEKGEIGVVEFLFGVKFSAVDYAGAAEYVGRYIDLYHAGKVGSNYVVTPHSEFIYKAWNDSGFQKIINEAYLSLPDGISVIWLDRFMSYSLKSRFFTFCWIEVILHMLKASYFTMKEGDRAGRTIKQRVIGADFIDYLYKLANDKSYTIFLLGGFGGVGEKVAKVMKKKYTAVNTVGTFEGSPSIHDRKEIKKVLSAKRIDILIVAYGSIKEEQWIYEMYKSLDIPISIGVGRGLDYITGRYKRAPRFFIKYGLEWLYKMVTDWSRFKRQLVVFKLMGKAMYLKRVAFLSSD